SVARGRPNQRSWRSCGLAVGLIMLMGEGAPKRASGSAGRRSSMVGDPFVARLVELDQGCLELTERLERLREAVVEVGRMRKRGLSVSEIVSSGPGIPVRPEVRASSSRLNKALPG